jgi:hypothetical protein
VTSASTRVMIILREPVELTPELAATVGAKAVSQPEPLRLHLIMGMDAERVSKAIAAAAIA